jgi:hypothetical protein
MMLRVGAQRICFGRVTKWREALKTRNESASQLVARAFRPFAPFAIQPPRTIATVPPPRYTGTA